MLEGNKYIANSTSEVDAFLSSLSLNYTISKSKTNIFTLSLFDTFNWSLFKKNKYFYSVNEKLYYQSFNGRHKRIKIPLQKHYLPDESFENKEFSSIKKITSLRVISKQAKWQVEKKTYKLFNKEGEKIAVINFEIFSFKTQKNLLIRIEKNKNHQEDFEFINNWASKNNLVKIKNNSIQVLLNKRNIFPLKYTSKIHLECNPDTPIFLSLREIFEKGNGNLISNFKGIKKNLDTEFLHDFRTTTRRLKSALSQFKNSCHKNIYEIIKYHLTHLQKSTNDLRDLDVDLISKSEFFKLIPKDQTEDLNILFKLIKDKRKEAFKKFMIKVDNFDINDSIQELNKFVSNLYSNNSQIPDKAREPIKNAADEILKSRFEKIILMGNLLDENSTDDQIHAVRLQCKKLRYSLEFFKNYFPEKRIVNFISRLKQLQDNLGKFNDLSVQIDRLDYFKEEFTNSDNTRPKLINILNFLLENKISQKNRIKVQFFDLLKSFLSKRTKTSFYNLFTS